MQLQRGRAEKIITKLSHYIRDAMDKLKKYCINANKQASRNFSIADHLAKLAKFKEQGYTFRHRILTDNIGMLKRI
jgi:hypothetical protein